MLKTWKRPIALLAALLMFVAASCGDDDSGESSDTTAAPAESSLGIEFAALTGTANGTGASFPDVYYQKVKSEFAEVATDATINYTKSGSSAGKTDLANQVVQFAGTDSTVKDEDLPTFKGGEILYFPTVAAPITVSYNLPGVDEINLSADTLAGIMQAEITSWDDDAIKADNPDADLPSTAIAVVHRSDGSGTTNNFTKFLVAAAPDVWKLKSGDTVNWPTSTQGAEKNSGVAAVIADTEGAVGYVDLADAVSSDLQLASIQNAAGEFVQPTLDAASAALAGATIEPDLTYNPLNAEGAESYPITAPTWIIVYKTQPDAATAELLQGWIGYILTDGQDFAGGVGFAALPDELRDQAIEQLDLIGG